MVEIIFYEYANFLKKGKQHNHQENHENQVVKTEPNFSVTSAAGLQQQQHLSSSAAVSQQSTENNQQSQQSAEHDVVVELQQFVASSAETTTAAQIILVCLCVSYVNITSNFFEKNAALSTHASTHSHPQFGILPIFCLSLR